MCYSKLVTLPETLPIQKISIGGETIKNVNIKDVAKEAGVAVSTVSRVINNHSDVKDATKIHVLKVIKQLNYIPNNSARNLKRSVTNNIGIFVLGEYNPFFGEIVASLEHEISSRGYAAVVHFHANENDSVEAAAELILEKKLIGLLHLGGLVTKDKESYFEGLNAPIVFISAVFEKGVNKNLFSSLTIDDTLATGKVMDYLFISGHKKIAMIITEKEGRCTSIERYNEYKKSIINKGFQFNESLIEKGDFSIKSGYEAMNRLLKNNNDISAVFAVNDLMAIGAIKSVFDAGLSVPEDISIVGFDGLEIGHYYNPSLTTIKQPSLEFGKIGSSLLFDQIEYEKDVKHIVLDTEFIIRESCRNLI